MKTLMRIAVIFGMFLNAACPLYPQETFTTLDDIRVDGKSVVMTLSGKTKYYAFKISNPPRLIVEFTNTEFNFSQKEIAVNGEFVKKVRSGQFQNKPVKITRIVLELTKPVEYQLHGDDNKVLLSLGDAPAEAAAGTTEAPKAQAKTAPAPAPAKTVPVKAVAAAAAPVKTAASSVAAKPAVPVQPKPALQTATAVKKDPVKTASAPAAPAVQKTVQVAAKPAQPAAPAVKTAVQAGEVKKPATAIVQPAVKAAPAQSVSPAKPKINASPKPATAAKKATAVKKTKPAAASPKPVKSVSSRTMLPTMPVSLDFEEIDVRDVFRVLSIKSGINIIYGNDVSGTITLHLENVPFDRAFDTILSLRGLVSQEQGPNILRIATPQQISTERSQAVTFTKIFPLNYAKAEEVKMNLDSIRSAEGRRGNISIDARTNSLIITDTPEGLISAERIVTELDKRPYQVAIEAKLVEVVLSDNKDIGIQWQYASSPYNSGNTQVYIGATEASASDSALGTAATVGGTVRSVVTPSAGGTGVVLPATPVEGQIGSIAFGLLVDNNMLTGALTALQQKGLSKLLSNPRVTTLNNQTARILIGERVPFTNVTIGAGGVSTTNTRWEEVGIKLEVNPTINSDQRITLKIKPEVSLVTAQTAAGPIIASREADTTVMIKNGETIVIGGLIREEDRKLGTQVPLLGELPVIGHLFRRDFHTKERSELLVFITPQIIE